MSRPGDQGSPLRVAVVGSGPAGFFVVEHLFRQPGLDLTVDLFERLPVPYGLVRFGVAPDHLKIKNVVKKFEKTASDPRFRFFGNVEFGRHLTLDDLRGTDCPYCHTALPHHAQAAQHAALVNQMLAQQGVNYQVPYQYGAAPPPAQTGPGAVTPGYSPMMPPQVAAQVQQSVDTAQKAVATSMIVTVAIVVAVFGIILVAGVGMVFAMMF